MKRKWTALLLLIILLAIQAGPEPMAKENKKQDGKQAMIEAREKFFGKENVNSRTGEVRKDRVILSWYGVSNYAAAINGHVVLLDAWIPRGIYRGYVPAEPEELAALKPEAVFIGHAHFDHAADAPEIIDESGAKVVGTAEHCEWIKGQVEGDTDVSCVTAADEGAEPGTVTNLQVLEGVSIKAVKHVHSGLEHRDQEDKHERVFLKPDVSYAVKNPAKPKELLRLLKSTIADEEGGTMLYQFTVKNFTLTWNDSSGPVKEEAPEMKKILGSLPETDVQTGAIMGFNQYTNGLRDPVMYMKALRPKVFVPNHHDNWAPPITAKGENYHSILTKEIRQLPKKDRPKLIFMSDPEDYIKPERLTFSINDKKWK